MFIRITFLLYIKKEQNKGGISSKCRLLSINVRGFHHGSL